MYGFVMRKKTGDVFLELRKELKDPGCIADPLRGCRSSLAATGSLSIVKDVSSG